MLRTPIAVLLAGVALAAVAGPVAAASSAPMSDYGNTVNCRYSASGQGPAYDWRLKSLAVTAPVLYAKSGTQKVGWRFVVTRAKWWGTEPWKVTYRSPIQVRTATTTSAAAFVTEQVDVRLPHVENTRALVYHVTLKLFWYRANGTVLSTTSYLMPWMKWI